MSTAGSTCERAFNIPYRQHMKLDRSLRRVAYAATGPQGNAGAAGQGVCGRTPIGEGEPMGVFLRGEGLSGSSGARLSLVVHAAGHENPLRLPIPLRD